MRRDRRGRKGAGTRVVAGADLEPARLCDRQLPPRGRTSLRRWPGYVDADRSAARRVGGGPHGGFRIGGGGVFESAGTAAHAGQGYGFRTTEAVDPVVRTL